MERKKDSKNILIAGLLIAIMVMSVGFALLSSNLEIEATGIIGSGEWAVKFQSNSLTQTKITDGVSNVSAELDNDGLKLTINATFEKPGDSLSYRILVENTGTIDAYLKDASAVGLNENTEAIRLSYEVKDKTETTTYTKGTITGTTLTEEIEPIAEAKLIKKNAEIIDINYVDITLEYLETSEEITPGAEATYTLYLYYEQPKATANNE